MVVVLCAACVCKKKKLKNYFETIYLVPYCPRALMNDRGPF